MAHVVGIGEDGVLLAVDERGCSVREDRREEQSLGCAAVFVARRVCLQICGEDDGFPRRERLRLRDESAELAEPLVWWPDLDVHEGHVCPRGAPDREVVDVVENETCARERLGKPVDEHPERVGEVDHTSV